MEEKSKKIRGSAVVDEDGLFVFTPYGTRPNENDGFKLVKTFDKATLWLGKEGYSLRMKIPNRPLPPLTQIVKTVISAYSAMRSVNAKKSKS